MELTGFNLYLVIINVIGFILFTVSVVLYTYTTDKHIDPLLTITTLLGGSLGILFSMLLFDRRAHKATMMSRVFIWSVFGIQIVIFLVLNGYIKTNLTFKFWEFFHEHKGVIIYLLVINIITFIAYWLDKQFAIHKMWRIQIVTLLILAFLGGSIGALTAMYLFRHKTSKDYFTVGVPLIILMQVIILFYLMNSPWIN